MSEYDKTKLCGELVIHTPKNLENSNVIHIVQIAGIFEDVV